VAEIYADMTAIQLNEKKLEIIGMLMNTDNEKTVMQLWNIAHEAEQTLLEHIPGIAHTNEELIAAVNEGLEDIRAGRVYSTEEIFKPYAQWL
jgi:predicted transcriptional regulator